MLLSITIPVFNEGATIKQLLEAVLAVDVGCEKEVIVVDDCSTDSTREVLAHLGPGFERVSVHLHDENQGKGAALRTAFAAATGDIVLIQDADLEYNPKDYPRLLEPILDGHADVVFGSRFLGGGAHRVVYYWHYLGNRLLTLFSNMMTNLNLTDMEVCFKVFTKEVLRGITIREHRFGFEPEITAKVARGEWRIYEVPISYYGRTYTEGKKITWRDGFSALRCILKYRFLD